MNWIDSHKRIDEGVTVGNCKMNRLLFAHELVLHAWIFSAGSSARILSVFCCVRLRRKENRHWKDCGIAGFLRRFRDPSRVPKIENRVPRIRENRVSTSQTNRVPTGPYRVPNIFLKKNLAYCVSQDAQGSVFCKWAEILCNRWRRSFNLRWFSQVTEVGTKGLIHGLVKQTHFSMSFIASWWRNGSFQRPQSFRFLISVFVPILTCGYES